MHGSQVTTQMIPRVSVQEAVRAAAATSVSRGAEGAAVGAGRQDDAADDAPEGSAGLVAADGAEEPGSARTDVAEPSGAGRSGAEPTGGEATRDEPGDAEHGDADGARADLVPSGRAWDPVPVPRPTYTMKPSAPRREPAPLPQEDPAPAAGARTAVEAPPAPERAEGDVQKPRTETLGLDLNEILARRRAAGQ
ncbi:hypothetical protein [Cellulosimicrobium sp. CUA-896]|uniref:hypothetical protein n=1 Tax=Cellulosimicrobium sp. CUA-896 TaxID=1517881 RepID=UPI00095F1F7A|nr:hypothetical protein [Cellulosimicrobium sp. CUA-896]OLT54136.1 hypothetical protein BJF88_10185 [Cellulosimicrobium sp. CUA-896]